MCQTIALARATELPMDHAVVYLWTTTIAINCCGAAMPWFTKHNMTMLKFVIYFDVVSALRVSVWMRSDWRDGTVFHFAVSDRPMRTGGAFHSHSNILEAGTEQGGIWCSPHTDTSSCARLHPTGRRFGIWDRHSSGHQICGCWLLFVCGISVPDVPVGAAPPSSVMLFMTQCG